MKETQKKILFLRFQLAAISHKKVWLYLLLLNYAELLGKIISLVYLSKQFQIHPHRNLLRVPYPIFPKFQCLHLHQR